MSKPVISCVDDEKVVLHSLRTQLKEAFGTTYLHELAENAVVCYLSKRGTYPTY